jgi:hypothetical protein
VAALVVQIALAAALAVGFAPQFVGAASAGLAALRLPAPPDPTSALVWLNGWLAAAGAALAGLARAGDVVSVGPFGAFSAAQWVMLLAGVGVVWFFGNRFLLAGSPERRGNHYSDEQNY